MRNRPGQMLAWLEAGSLSVRNERMVSLGELPRRPITSSKPRSAGEG